MLYPDFNELIQLKRHKLKAIPQISSKIKSTIAGNHHTSFRGRGLEFDSVREYVVGDDIRNIDWRVTARSGKPHIKLFKEDRERQILICLDMHSYMRFGTKITFKSVVAAKIAALLGWQAIANQDKLSVCLFGDVESGIQLFKAAKNRYSFSRMLKTIAFPQEHNHTVTFQNILKHIQKIAQPGSIIYLISDFLSITDQTVDAHLSRLKKQCQLSFISVNDRGDMQLPPLGMLGFRGNSSETIFVDTKSDRGREAYRLQWEKSRAALEALSVKFKIPLIKLSTESTLLSELPLLLRNSHRIKRK